MRVQPGFLDTASAVMEQDFMAVFFYFFANLRLGICTKNNFSSVLKYEVFHFTPLSAIFLKASCFKYSHTKREPHFQEFSNRLVFRLL